MGVISERDQDELDELARERAKRGIPSDGSPNGRSIADMVSDEPDPDAESGEEEDEEREEDEDVEELFVLDQGRRVTLGKLIPPGIPVEYRVKFEGKSIKGGNDMGLLPYTDPDMILVMSAREGKVDPVPTYDDEGRLTKVTLNVYFKPRVIHDATSYEGRALLGLEDG